MKATDILGNEGKQNVNVKAVASTILLSHNHELLELKLLIETEKGILKGGWRYLLKFEKEILKSIDEKTLSKLILEEIGNFIAGIGNLADLKMIYDTVEDTYKFWSLVNTSVPILGKIAMALLNITPSEASVERSFAIQKFVHRDLRNRLKPEMVRAWDVPFSIFCYQVPEVPQVPIQVPGEQTRLGI